MIAALLAVNTYRAATEPCTSAESVVYERYAAHPILEFWNAPFDPRLGLVYGIVARAATRLGGVSELTIRLPSILGGLLFWLALAGSLRRWFAGWTPLLVFVLIAANPWVFRAFSTVSGVPLALGLLAAGIHKAKHNLAGAGALFALAIGSDALATIPAMLAAVAIARFWRIEFWRWIDSLVIPSAVVSLVFLFPLMPTRPKPLPAASDDTGTREMMRVLMHQKHASSQVPVGVSRTIEPGVFFYRRRYHLEWMRIAPLDADNSFDVIAASDRMLIAKLGLHVVGHTANTILAAPGIFGTQSASSVDKSTR